MIQTRRARRTALRSGFALIDVVVAGIILGVGMTVLLSTTSRALLAQSDAERRLVATWLADELLSMVIVEGPIIYPQIHDNSGRFEDPFEDYEYDLEIADNGLGVPYSVIATVRWESGRRTRDVRIETLVAVRQGEPEQPRIPLEPIDRESRYYEDEEY